LWAFAEYTSVWIGQWNGVHSRSFKSSIIMSARFPTSMEPIPSTAAQ
jgi:hypothetical protein